LETAEFSVIEERNSYIACADLEDRDGIDNDVRLVIKLDRAVRKRLEIPVHNNSSETTYMMVPVMHGG